MIGGKQTDGRWNGLERARSKQSAGHRGTMRQQQAQEPSDDCDEHNTRERTGGRGRAENEAEYIESSSTGARKRPRQRQRGGLAERRAEHNQTGRQERQRACYRSRSVSDLIAAAGDCVPAFDDSGDPNLNDECRLEVLLGAAE